MRILGAKWVAATLYPARFPVDMVKGTEEFYRLFLHLDLSDAEARDILQGK
jgi:iron complex transport system substrate-binding protein